MQILNGNPKITPLLVIVTAIESQVLLVTGVGLLLAPSIIGALWPWDLSPFNALLLGAVYTASLVATSLLAIARRWAPARIVVPMISAFTVVILAVCWIYIDRFDFSYWGTWLWFLLYVGIPANGLFHMWLYRNRVPVNASPLSRFWRVACLVPILLMGLYGLGLLVAPDTFSAFWPWPIDGFHGRMYSVIYLTPAVGAALLFGAAASIELLTMGLTQVVGGVIPIVGLIIIDGQLNKVDWSAPGTWLWIGSFAIIGLTGMGLVRQSAARSRWEEPLADQDS